MLLRPPSRRGGRRTGADRTHKPGPASRTCGSLEMRLLAAGVTVTRRAAGRSDSLSRKNDDQSTGVNCGFFTFKLHANLDIERSRSFAPRNPRSARWCRRRVACSMADAKRRPYEPGSSALVVSPANARTELAKFIRGAQNTTVDLRSDHQRSGHASTSSKSAPKRASMFESWEWSPCGAAISPVNKPPLRLHARGDDSRRHALFSWGARVCRPHGVRIRGGENRNHLSRQPDCEAHRQSGSKRTGASGENRKRRPDHKDDSDTFVEGGEESGEGHSQGASNPSRPVLKMVIRELTGGKKTAWISARKKSRTPVRPTQ